MQDRQIAVSNIDLIDFREFDSHTGNNDGTSTLNLQPDDITDVLATNLLQGSAVWQISE